MSRSIALRDTRAAQIKTVKHALFKVILCILIMNSEKHNSVRNQTDWNQQAIRSTRSQYVSQRVECTTCQLKLVKYHASLYCGDFGINYSLQDHYKRKEKEGGQKNKHCGTTCYRVKHHIICQEIQSIRGDQSAYHPVNHKNWNNFYFPLVTSQGIILV